METTKTKRAKLFRNIVVAAVLVIPFMYSFFYLKAYWNPYGEGNIDNLPVALVNEDKGDKGGKLVESIKESGKLRLEEKTAAEAEDCLYDSSCYAMIKIPSDFTESMESAGTTNKKHATVTYSPNQKSNYLASQIINSVVNAVEKSLDNQVNSAVIGNLTDSLNEVPTSLETISNGFGTMKDGTSQLKSGSVALYDGTITLNNGLVILKNGINSAYLGSKTIETSIDSTIAKYKSSNVLSDEQVAAIKSAAATSATATVGSSFTNTYKAGLGAQTWTQVKAQMDASTDTTLQNAYNTAGANITSTITAAGNSILAAYFNNDTTRMTKAVLCAQSYQPGQALSTACTDYVVSYGAAAMSQDLNMIGTVNTQLKTNIGGKITSELTTIGATTKNYLYSTVETTVKQVAPTVAEQAATTTAGQVASQVAGQVSNQVANEVAITTLNTVKAGVDQLTAGLNELANGNKVQQLYSGVASLSEGAYTLANGISTLDNSVANAKSELDTKIDETKENLKSTEGLSEYAEAPVTIENETVNAVDSYGTSFAPLFISIGLWVGALMSFVVLYYDKQKRFGLLGIDSKSYVKRTLAYHAIATAAGVVLAALLQIFLDFNITNVFLYYISVVLIANTFMAIMELLIVNFGDVGKFLGLIILVLQLAASGGTFPIETVSEGFRWLNECLPMTYTIKLLRESLISTESSMLVPNLIIVTVMCVVLSGFNILNSIRKVKHNK